MSRNIKIVLLFVTVSIFSVESKSCTCLGDRSSIKLEHYEKYEFIARVEIDTTDKRYYKFLVRESFKNELPKILLYPRRGNSSCSQPVGWEGDEFIHKNWLLYFNDIDDSARIDIYLCGRSRGFNLRFDSTLLEKNIMPMFGSSKTEIDFLRVCGENFKAQNLQYENEELVDRVFLLKAIIVFILVLLMIITPFLFKNSKKS